MTLNSQQPKRLLLGLTLGNILLIMVVFFQRGEEELLDRRIEGREERLATVREILEKNPQLIQSTGPRSPTDKDLSTLINETLTSQGLTHHVVSQNPTVDVKKNEEKIKLQLKDVPLGKVVELMKSLQKAHPKIREVEMDLTGGEATDQWKFLASWVMPLSK